MKHSNQLMHVKHACFWCSWCLTLSEDGEARFRQPKTVYEEHELVKKTIPLSTKYESKWRVTIFDEWQISWMVIDPGGLFKGYDLHKVAQFSTSIEEMDAVTLNQWLSKFVMEVAKKSVGEISTEDHLWNNLFQYIHTQ